MCIATTWNPSQIRQTYQTTLAFLSASDDPNLTAIIAYRTCDNGNGEGGVPPGACEGLGPPLFVQLRVKVPASTQVSRDPSFFFLNR